MTLGQAAEVRIARARAVGWAALACAAVSVGSFLDLVRLLFSSDRLGWETRFAAGLAWFLMGHGGFRLVTGRLGRWQVFIGATLATVVVLSDLVNIATRPPVVESRPAVVDGLYLLLYLGLALAVLWLRDVSDERARGE